MRVLKFLALVIIAIPLLTYLDSLRLDWKLNTAQASLASEYPIGMSLDAARLKVAKRFPLRYHESNAAECVREAQNSSSSFEPKGGPCLGVFWDVGSTWYGFESGIQFRLFFDGSNTLVDLSARQVHTFL